MEIAETGGFVLLGIRVHLNPRQYQAVRHLGVHEAVITSEDKMDLNVVRAYNANKLGLNPYRFGLADENGPKAADGQPLFGNDGHVSCPASSAEQLARELVAAGFVLVNLNLCAHEGRRGGYLYVTYALEGEEIEVDKTVMAKVMELLARPYRRVKCFLNPIFSQGEIIGHKATASLSLVAEGVAQADHHQLGLTDDNGERWGLICRRCDG